MKTCASSRLFRSVSLVFCTAGLAVSLSGCASIFTGGSQTAMVTSEPEGAKCQAGAYAVVTPGSVPVKRSSSPVQVICKKEGYETG
jgi:hypothetical protein